MAHWQILRMFELFLVGIGTGNPEHITIQARRAIEEADSILIPYKGSEKSDLVDVRLKICKEIVKGKKPRLFSLICLQEICRIPTKRGLRNGMTMWLEYGQAPFRKIVLRILKLLF